MKKVLITLPNSIAGSLIMRGFSAGFRANGCHVLEKDLRELSINDIKRYNPDIILGYDYGFLFYEQKDLVDYILNSEQNYKIVHYFADEPNGKFAYVDKPELYQTFVDISKSRKNVFSFVWDKDFVDEFFNCKYLPLAVNYKSYLSNEIIPYEISFVGRPLTDKRQEILAALVKKFGKKLSIFCYEKHFLQSVDEMKQKQLLSDKELELYKSSYKGFLAKESEIADVYFNSKVNINITLQGKSGLNYRVFEVLASKGFLLTDEMNDIKENFIVSKELETYKDIDDLIDKVDFYLKNPIIAKKIAILGFANIAKKHSYTVRARTILDTLKNPS